MSLNAPFETVRPPCLAREAGIGGRTFDYVKRDVMIPMRDGVKLHTVIVVPKGAAHAPILLTRTPYNASVLTGQANSAHLGSCITRRNCPSSRRKVGALVP